VITLNTIFAIIMVLIDYNFSNSFLLFPGLTVLVVITSKNIKLTLLQIFIFFSSYFLFFSSISLLWTIFYLILAYLFKTVLIQINSLKFEIPFLIGLSGFSYIPFLHVQSISKVTIWYGIGFWLLVTIIYILKRRSKSGEEV